MCAKWVKKYNPNIFVDDIKARRLLDDSGKVSFRGSSINEVIAVMVSAIELEPSLVELEKEALIRESVFGAAKHTDLLPHHLLSEVSRREKAYSRRANTRYTLISSLSFKYLSSLRCRKINGVDIMFDRSTPVRFDRSPLKHRLSAFSPSTQERQFVKVRASLLASSQLQAAEQALDAIDLWRALWNLYLNRCSIMRVSTGRKQPVNQIRYGQIHTLHKSSGELATDTFWYEPEYVDPTTVKDIRSQLPKVADCEHWARTRLKSNPHKDFIENALRRYVRALDEKKLDNAFLKLWAILENLTGTVGESYDRTIRRTVFRYKDRTRERQVLEHLRDHRNRAIHHLQFSEQVETLVYQLKRYVEDLLVFHINRLRTFDSLDECWMFLDSTRDRAEIERRLRINKRTLRMIDRQES